MHVQSVQNYCFPLLKMKNCDVLLIVVMKCELVKCENVKRQLQNGQAKTNLKTQRTNKNRKIWQISKMFSLRFLETFKIISSTVSFVMFKFRAMLKISCSLVVIQRPFVQKEVNFIPALSVRRSKRSTKEQQL